MLKINDCYCNESILLMDFGANDESKVLKILLTIGALSLAGCQHKLSQSQNQPVDKVYTGVLPCADCSGIETTVLF